MHYIREKRNTKETHHRILLFPRVIPTNKEKIVAKRCRTKLNFWRKCISPIKLRGRNRVTQFRRTFVILGVVARNQSGRFRIWLPLESWSYIKLDNVVGFIVISVLMLLSTPRIHLPNFIVVINAFTAITIEYSNCLWHKSSTHLFVLSPKKKLPIPKPRSTRAYQQISDFAFLIKKCNCVWSYWHRNDFRALETSFTWTKLK